MKCRKAQLLINKLLDNEIKETDYHQLEAHLATCSKCCQIYNDLKVIRSGARVAAAGEGGTEPSSEVWEKLKGRLEAEIIPLLRKETTAEERKKEMRRKTFHRLSLTNRAWKYSAALFIILAMIAGAFFLGRHLQQPAGQKSQLADQQVLEKIEEAGFYYRQAIESLTEAMKLSAADNRLPPEIAEILQVNLQLLDRTIDLCQQAVNQEPDNLQARDYLLSAYNSKLNFLNNMLETTCCFRNFVTEKL